MTGLLQVIVGQLLSVRLFQSKIEPLMYTVIVRMVQQKKLDDGVLKEKLTGTYVRKELHIFVFEKMEGWFGMGSRCSPWSKYSKCYSQPLFVEK